MSKYRDIVEEAVVRLEIKGPRVLEQDVIDEICAVQYHQFPGTTVTVCLLTLFNGFTVVGDSACADPANFRQELGEKLAYEKAKNGIWQLLGFRLRDALSSQENAPAIED